MAIEKSTTASTSVVDAALHDGADALVALMHRLEGINNPIDLDIDEDSTDYRLMSEAIESSIRKNLSLQPDAHHRQGYLRALSLVLGHAAAGCVIDVNKSNLIELTGYAFDRRLA